MADFELLQTSHAGAALQGNVHAPAGPGPHPAVLVMSTAMGMGDLANNACAALAREGYLAVATDMYGGGAGFVDDIEASAKAIGPLMTEDGLLRARVVHWFEAVRALPNVDPARVAAIGYCFGGQCVLELARSGAEVTAVVSYHGLLTTRAPARPGAIKAQVCAYTGRLDPYAPRDHVEGFRDEMIAADARFHITELGNSWHSFTDPDAARVPVPGVQFDALARDVSWAGTLAVLKALC
ncbi:dienelactone hydrolase family protein [Novosphingobium bradum]|uniref:Dienelactone hydrolase family protein n=1 Tax=Novosphingobium bradum TaxID=1737444 RepID=A0ABV7IR66_9SPHN